VTAYLLQAATSAVYPNGTGGGANSSVAGIDVRLYEGWPIPEQLDLDIQGLVKGNPPTPRPNGPCANVSIFPMAGATAIPYQILDDTFVLTAPTYGMSASISGTIATIIGEPNAGEFLTIVADSKYIYSETGANTAAILSALATAASVNYSGVSSTSTTITIPVVKSLTVRIGGVGTLAKVTHRQKQAIMVTVWAPSHEVRTTLAAAIDVAIKSQIRVDMDDTTQAIILYSRTNQVDDNQNVSIYRRDLVYEVEYATLETFQGINITSVTNEISPLDVDAIPQRPTADAIT
jgi:hypothetical protein